MNGKTVLITGSTRGFGRALAEEFLSRGNRVVICSKNKDSVERASLELTSLYSDRVYPLVADVSRYEDCVRMTDDVIERYGSIDILINNAGTNAYKRQRFLEFESDDLDMIVNTNLLGTLHCCKTVMPHMLTNRSGVVVNMEGAGSERNETEGYAAYGATKAGITQFTQTLRKEYRYEDVHICLLSPGMMFTNLLLTDVTPEMEVVFDIFGEDPSHISELVVTEILKIDSHKDLRYLTWCKIVEKMVQAIAKRLHR